MLYPVLEYLNLYLAQFSDFNGITIELAPVPSNQQLANIPNSSTEKVLYISLLNIEEDRSVKPPYSYQRNPPPNPPTNPATIYTYNPEMRFFLYIMFTGYSGDYITSLKSITSVITAFANKNFFSGPDLTASWTNSYTGQFSDSFTQLAVDLNTISLDQNNSMWQAISSNILPNVIYKVRMLSILPTLTLNPVGEVRQISLNTISTN